MFEKVLKNGQVFLGDRFIKADLAIEGEKIAAIGIELAGKKEIDTAGKWVLPGIIDAHTHFSLPFAGAVSSDDFFSGTRAGAIGGVTTIIDFLAQKGNEGFKDSFSSRMAIAEGQAAVDYSFHACIGRFSEQVKNEMAELENLGLTSLKVFMAYGKSGLMQSDASMLEIMKHCRHHGILLTLHAENGLLIDELFAKAQSDGRKGIRVLPETRPVISEAEAIRRAGMLARETGCNLYIVHTSSGAGADEIAGLKASGAPIIGETCPQYLYLDDSLFEGTSGHFFSCCPPIRPIIQQKNLWKNLLNRNLAVIATDHCPFLKKEKDGWQNDIANLPMGLPGVEVLGALVLNRNNCLDPVTAIKVLTENPARIFGLYPEKGSLEPGTDADICVFDPAHEWQINHRELHMANDYSPYEGLKIQGRNCMTFLRGEMIFDSLNGWAGKKGAGKFLKRKKTDQVFFS